MPSKDVDLHVQYRIANARMKTPDSFHGVEPITQPDVQRDLLLYDIRSQHSS